MLHLRKNNVHYYMKIKNLDFFIFFISSQSCENRGEHLQSSPYSGAPSGAPLFSSFKFSYTCRVLLKTSVDIFNSGLDYIFSALEQEYPMRPLVSWMGIIVLLLYIFLENYVQLLWLHMFFLILRPRVSCAWSNFTYFKSKVSIKQQTIFLKVFLHKILSFVSR